MHAVMHNINMYSHTVNIITCLHVYFLATKPVLHLTSLLLHGIPVCMHVHAYLVGHLQSRCASVHVMLLDNALANTMAQQTCIRTTAPNCSFTSDTSCSIACSSLSARISQASAIAAVASVRCFVCYTRQLSSHLRVISSGWGGCSWTVRHAQQLRAALLTWNTCICAAARSLKDHV